MYKKKKDILVLHTSDVDFWLGINRVGTVNADIEANFLWCVLQTKQVNIITEQFFFNNSLTFVQWWEFKPHVAVVLSAP